MKLWKAVTFAIMLCGAALSIFLTRNMSTIGQFEPRIEDPESFSSSSSSSLKSSPPLMEIPLSSPRSTPSSWSSSTALSSLSSSAPLPPSPTSSSSFSSEMGGLHRAARETESISSLLSEYSRLLQSFTEGELQKVIGTLVDRRVQRDSQEGNQDENQEESQEENQEDSQTRRTKRAKRRPQPCSLRELELMVSELGLGYDSDETLLFRYCSGKCTARRRNYDITLESVRRAGLIKRGRKDQVGHTPCCRPITYEEDISFLDNNSRYHTIQEVSAKECGCV